MAKFNTNQNRQFYVAKDVKVVDASHSAVETLTTVGDTAMMVTPKKDAIYFIQKGQGGLVRSDLIPIKSVTYAKLSTAANMARKLKATAISLSSTVNSGAPIAGQDYIVTITIRNAFGGGLDDVYVKAAANVHATTGLTATKFYEALKASLDLNFSRELNKWFDFVLIGTSGSYTGVAVEEKELSWNLGKMSDDGIQFDIQVAPVVEDHAEVNWATLTDYTSTYNTKVGNGKKVADMEYFFHGERGDKYRDSIGDMAIPTKYMVDPSATYDMLDIHYSYQGSCEDIQKSEKDVTIVVPSTNSSGDKAADFAQFLADNGIEVIAANGSIISATDAVVITQSESEGVLDVSTPGGTAVGTITLDE